MKRKKLLALLPVALSIISFFTVLSVSQVAAASGTSVKLITGGTVNGGATGFNWATSTCSATFSSESETSADFTNALGGTPISSFGSFDGGPTDQQVQYMNDNIQNDVPILKLTGGSGCSGITLVPIAGSSATPSVPNEWYGEVQFSVCINGTHGCSNQQPGPVRFTETSSDSNSVTGKLTYISADNNSGTPSDSTEGLATYVNSLNTTSSTFTVGNAEPAISVPKGTTPTTYDPGCYSPTYQSLGAGACTAAGATTDTSGDPFSTDADCYVEGTGTDGSPDDLAWAQVSCNDLKTAVNPQASSTSTQQELQCELSILNPLTWLVCPIVAAANAAVGQLDSAINDLLNFDVGTYLGDTAVDPSTGQPVDPTLSNGDTNPAPELYSAWSGFRTIALSLIAIAGLVMVFAQAIGSEAIDAYTIKKVLPRIFVAAIVIALSWQLMKILIQLSDDIGYGIRALIYAPFSSFPQLKVTTGTSSALALIGGGALLGLDLIGLLSFAATALIAVLVGFGLLVFRKIVLLFLIVLSPIAIACFVLPNTQKLWKLWWNNFSKLLIMFPIVAGFIAIGRVFAAISYTSSTGSLLDQITGIIAYFGPYFLIPVAFKMAGGIGAMAGSFAGKLGSAARKPISGFRSKKLQQHAHELKHGTRYTGKSYIPGSTAVAQRFGKITKGAGMGIGKNFGLGIKGEQAHQQIGDARANEILQSKEYAAFKDNEEGNRALTYGSAKEAQDQLVERYMKQAEEKDARVGIAGSTQRADAQKAAEERATTAVRAAQVSGLKFGDDAVKIAAAKSLIDTGTGYEDLQDMTETLARASEGNKTIGTSLAGYANYRNKQTGRWDLAPGFGNAQGLVHEQMDKGKGGSLSAERYAAASVAAAQGTDAVTLLRQKPEAVKNLTQSLAIHYKEQFARSQDTSLTVDERREAFRETIKTNGLMKQLDQSKGYASTLVQNHVNDMYNNDAGVAKIRQDIAPVITAQEAIDPSTGNKTMVPPTSPDMAAYWEQVSPRNYNPNDPHNSN